MVDTLRTRAQELSKQVCHCPRANLWVPRIRLSGRASQLHLRPSTRRCPLTSNSPCHVFLILSAPQADTAATVPQLPAHIFDDVSVGGPLQLVLQVCCEHQQRAQWSNLAAADAKDVLTLLGGIKTTLVRARTLSSHPTPTPTPHPPHPSISDACLTRRMPSVQSRHGAWAPPSDGQMTDSAKRRRVNVGGDAMHVDSESNGAPVTMPSHSAWFSFERVHSIEHKALPEFFDGSSTIKTPETYQQMRNFIVATYREQPSLHLSVTEVRRNLAVDVAAATRLHQFLEHWGIINYNASAARGALRPGTKVSFDAPLPSMSAAACLATRQPLGDDKAAWSDEDTLALLEALEKYEDSWADVAAHVGKPADQCVHRFLQLPIQEPYLGGELQSTRTASDQLGSASDPPADPMLSQLALLAKSVGDSAPSAPGAADPAADASATSAARSLSAAATNCLAAVQRRAQQVESETAAKMQVLLASAVEVQLRRLEAKMTHLQSMTSLLEHERAELQRTRHQIFAERYSLEKKRQAQAPQTAQNNYAAVVAASAPQ